MAADADAEIEATLTRLKTLVGGNVFETALPDDANPPRNPNGSIAPHIIAIFGAAVRSTRDRILSAGEVSQPHTLPLNLVCVAGTASAARKTAKDATALLLDWAPSASSDTYRAEGGYGGSRAATTNSPSRFVRGVFLETTVNHVYPVA